MREKILGLSMFRNWEGESFLLVLFTALLIIGAFEQSAFPKEAVPAAPNESIIIGEVLQYSILSSTLLDIKPEQTLYCLRVFVLSSQNVNTKPNFTKNKVGEMLNLYSKQELSPELFDKKVKVRVSFRGDERGGRFWIKDIKIIPCSEREEQHDEDL